MSKLWTCWRNEGRINLFTSIVFFTCFCSIMMHHVYNLCITIMLVVAIQLSHRAFAQSVNTESKYSMQFEKNPWLKFLLELQNQFRRLFGWVLKLIYATTPLPTPLYLLIYKKTKLFTFTSPRLMLLCKCDESHHYTTLHRQQKCCKFDTFYTGGGGRAGFTKYINPI